MSSPLYYLGPEETFSYSTAVKMCRSDEVPVACKSFREIFESVLSNPFSAGIVPFENTTQGQVTEVMDLLAEFQRIKVNECRAINIVHNLLVRDLDAPIEKICSHPQALAQCRNWLRREMPGVKLESVDSTAEAARRAMADSSVAAIASIASAQRYGLTAKAVRIQDITENSTRFFRISTRDASSLLPPSHTLLYLILDDKPGALLSVLTPFRDAGINLTLIQSRPIRGESWKYGFFIEALTATAAKPLSTVLGSLQNYVRVCRVLGIYSISTQREPVAGTEMTTLSSLRMMIASLDEKLVSAFGHRADLSRNRSLYTHEEIVSHQMLADAFSKPSNLPEQMRLLRCFYIQYVLPAITHDGDDTNPRAALHADNECMTALSQRFNFATHVIARKQIEIAPKIREAAIGHDVAKIESALLNADVENSVLERACDIARNDGACEEQLASLRKLYVEHILPVSRLIQVCHILATTETENG